MSRYKNHVELVRYSKWDRIASHKIPVWPFPYYHELLRLYDYVFLGHGFSPRRHKKLFLSLVMAYKNGLQKVDFPYILQRSLALQKKFKGTQAQRQRLQSAIAIMEKCL